MPTKQINKKAPSRRVSKIEKLQCQTILKAIDQYIPGEYVGPVKEGLLNKGIEVNNDKIYNVRRGFVHDLVVMNALLGICNIPEETTKSISAELNLIKS